MDGCERVGSLCPIAVSVSNSAAGSEGLPGESMRALVPISSSGVARARLPAGHRGHPTLRHIPSLGAGAKCGLVQILILLCVFASSANAVGTNFSTILAGSGQDMALAVTSDAQGNVYVAGRTYSPDFPVTADAFQVTFGKTCDAFVAKLGPNGQVIWATYLGGILDDWATGIAVDSSGNVWVAGYTRSPDFPLVNPIQSTPSDDFNAFAAKFDPTGSKLLYSTYLGGGTSNGAAGMVLDAAGNVYVAVNGGSATGYPGIYVDKLTPQGALVYSFFEPNGTAAGLALDAAGSVYVTGGTGTTSLSTSTTTIGFLNTAASQALVFKISPDGSRKIYQNTFGGSVQATGAAIAVDSAGEAWIAGSTSSADFPLVHPLQSSLGARPLWQSANGGSTWAPIDNLPFAVPLMTLVDPTTPTTLYEATADLGVFKSLDGGATWTGASSGLGGTNIRALAIDPVHPQILYASQWVSLGDGASSSVIYKSVNGAGSWSPIDSTPFAVSQLAVDAKNTGIVWEIGNALRKSTDGGVTWNGVTFPGPYVAGMALDPNVSGQVIAAAGFIFCSFSCGGNTPSIPLLYRSVDGGANWTQIAVSIQPSFPLLIDGSTNPSTIYDGLAYTSMDGGVTWTAIATPPPGMSPTFLALDPSGAVYADTASGVYVSHDHARTWTALSPLVASPATGALASVVPAGSSGTLYSAVNQLSTAGFVSKLSADGSTLAYSTYLRGHPSLVGFAFYASEPNVFMTQNWISAIALDAAGNATVTGGTRAVDFPTANPAQAANAGLADAFVTTISADGSKLNYSTYYGGSQDDAALAAALDFQGNPIFAGQTFSEDFPVPGGSTLPFSYGNAFVVKLLAPGPPVITSVLSAAGFQPGIEAGSWVMIQGANLANNYPGQTWAAADFVGNDLPTQLAGVSVTIDGKPAFVEYISPTQINVQAPTDTATGTVNVVVTNNGAVSAPAPAQLQTVAPALFMTPGYNAIASVLPAYTPVTSTAPAKPDDIVVLWGTGFGPTTPTVPAGTIVTGAPVTSTLPVVTVGGVEARVISSVLTTGMVGLYQITIQLPANVPTGTPAIQASIGGLQTQSGVTLFVGAQ